MKKILIVDDEIEICKIMKAFLTKKGFAAEYVASGEEALKAIMKEEPDLMLMDKRMPGMGGVGLLKALKEKKIGMPVIVLTGSQAFAEHADDITSLGYTHVLFKPIDLDVLLKEISGRLAGGGQP